MFQRVPVVLLIAAVPTSAAFGGLFWTTDQQAFENFMAAQNKQFKGIETFEPPDSFLVFPWHTILPAPGLIGNQPNFNATGGFPNGLVNKNLTILSNNTPFNAPTITAGAGLRLVGPAAGLPFAGANSHVVGSAFINDSTDLLFDALSPEFTKTGVGFDVIDTSAPRDIHIDVFTGENFDQEILKVVVPGLLAKTFFGVWSDTPITRINIGAVSFDQTTFGYEFVDNIQMWSEVPAPGAWALLGLAGLMGTRRRTRCYVPEHP